MNITNYLVEYLKSGNSVHINGIGVLAHEEIKAFFDPTTATFYPTRRNICIRDGAVDDNDFINFLASKECVSPSTASQIWKNYNDALLAKVKNEGSCQLGPLGVINFADGLFSFDSHPSASGSSITPLAPVHDVKTYPVDNASNPFDFFNSPDSQRPSAFLSSASLSSADLSSPSFPTPPASIPEPTPSPEPEPEPEPEPISDPEPTPSPEPEPEPISDPEPTSSPEPEPEPIPEPEPEPISDPEPEPEPNPEPISDPQSIDPVTALHELDAIDNPEPDQPEDKPTKPAKKQKEKARHPFWKSLLWILLILVILLACFAVIDHFLLNSRVRQWASSYIPQLAVNQASDEELADFPPVPVDYDRDAARDNITPFTFSRDGLQFSPDEIDARSQKIVSDMTPYLTKFLKQRKMSNYEDAFLYQVEQHVNARLSELLVDDEFYGQALLNYKDYVREYNMPMLKDRKLHSNSIAVQSELFESSTLENILSQVIPADEVIPEPTPAKTDKPKAAKPAKPAAPTSHIATQSKQGFDVIAGFSVNKANADALCRSLKAKGCDAYIINRNGLYYVSMGSASSRTEIESRFNHIKEWYKGDISIKKW